MKFTYFPVLTGQGLALRRSNVKGDGHNWEIGKTFPRLDRNCYVLYPDINLGNNKAVKKINL